MKKVTYLMTILFAVALMSTSCCKDDPVAEPTGITVSDLDGVWTFQSLNYNSTDYDLGSFELADLNDDHDYIQFDLNFVSETEVNLYMDYTGTDVTDANWDYFTTNGEYLSFKLDADVILIPHLNLELEITNVESFDGTILELEMLSCINSTAPINGVFTLTN